MQLSTIRNFLLASVAIGALAACETTTVGNGGGDNGGGDNGGETTLEVTTGTTDGSGDGSNGMRFADSEFIQAEDLLGFEEEVTLTLRAAKLFKVGDDGGMTGASSELVDATITTSKNEGGDLIATVNFGGETALINMEYTGFDCDGGPVTSSDGLDYCFDYVFVSPNVVMIYAYGWDYDIIDRQTEYMAVAGLETNPDLLAFKGLATYDGLFGVDWALIGDSFDETGLTLGDITINADFGAATIDGDFESDFVNGDFEGEIAGNGWTATTTTLDIDDEDVVSVDGGAQLDGVIYGPIGEETAGTIIVDAEILYEPEEDVFETYDLNGAGLFYACEEDAPNTECEPEPI